MSEGRREERRNRGREGGGRRSKRIEVYVGREEREEK